MYSVLNFFPERIPLFVREYKAGLYPSGLFYISKIISMLPGLIFEPLIFISILYWTVGMNPSFEAFSISALVAILTINASVACGLLFSNAFGSLEVAIATLVPSDYVLMITSGLFLKLSTIGNILSWTKYLSWLMYSCEALSILQWERVQNISK